MAKPRYEDELFTVLQGLDPKPSSEDPTDQIETVDTTKVPEVKPTPVPKPSSVTARNCFHHPDAHPLVLDLLLLRRYGPEFLGWEVETLERVVQEDFRTSISHVNLGKIQACRTLHLVDAPWERWEVFTWCGLALNGVPPDFDVMQVPTAAQCVAAVDMFNRIRTDVSWSSEVAAFVASAFDHDGIYFSIPPVEFISIRMPDLIDANKVRTLWPLVRGSKTLPKEDTIETEQLRRMLGLYEYLLEGQERLRTQLEILSHA